MSTSPELKFQALRRILQELGEVAVAFSGGVDSSFLLKVACDVLPGRAHALNATSLLQPPEEMAHAARLAAAIGAPLLSCHATPLAWPEFVVNPPDRCYHCKKRIFGLLRTKAMAKGIPHLADGTHADDLTQYRPGLRAIRELGIRSPLAEAKLTKPEIRQLSRELGLPNWRQLSSSCLATRLATGLEITEERLKTVARAEQFLHHHGFLGCRARISSLDAVRIELCRGDIGKMMADSLREETRMYFMSLGFKDIFLDLSGRDGVAA